EAERALLEREPLLDAPRRRGDERRLLRARAVRVLVGTEVEEAALVGVRRLRVGPVEGEADAREQHRALGMERVEGARLDQRLDDAAVDAAAVDPRAEVEEAGERAAARARGDDRLDRALAR